MAATNQIPANAPLALGKDIRDIQELKLIPSGWEWLWWALAILALVGLMIAVVMYLKKRRKDAPLPPPIPAHVLARQKLQAALALISQPKPFCVAVSDTVRQYLEGRFSFHAPDRTTEEFLYELQGTNLLTPDQKDGLGDFLKQCDMVKFAKYEPGEPELRGLHDSALRLIEETEPVPVPAGGVEQTAETGVVAATQP